MELTFPGEIDCGCNISQFNAEPTRIDDGVDLRSLSGFSWACFSFRLIDFFSFARMLSTTLLYQCWALQQLDFLFKLERVSVWDGVLQLVNVTAFLGEWGCLYATFTRSGGLARLTTRLLVSKLVLRYLLGFSAFRCYCTTFGTIGFFSGNERFSTDLLMFEVLMFSFKGFRSIFLRFGKVTVALPLVGLISLYSFARLGFIFSRDLFSLFTSSY